MFVVFLVEDAEYMIMSCPSSSPSNELTDTPGTGNTEIKSQDVCSQKHLEDFWMFKLETFKICFSFKIHNHVKLKSSCSVCKV